ncbi:hypothetical protein GCM10009848_21930 [Micromonospora lupini]
MVEAWAGADDTPTRPAAIIVMVPRIAAGLRARKRRMGVPFVVGLNGSARERESRCTAAIGWTRCDR